MINFKWYRKFCGGIWYKIHIKQMESMDRIIWSRTHNGYNIVEIENYNLKNKIKKYEN